MAKQSAENQRLQAAMQAATIDASKNDQLKDKRIQHLERKVIYTVRSSNFQH